MAYNSSILSEVYNFYQDTFTPRNSRFDAHKRSDLKNIYNSIVKESSNEPVFILDRSVDIQKYTISMKEGAMNFQRDIASLGGLDGDNLFNQKTVFSSDTNVADAQYYGNQTSLMGTNEDEASVQLDIAKLATVQTNRGYYIDADDIGIAPGVYSFDVATPISNYELQFSVGENDSNHSIQTRLAKLINNAAIGLNASVSYDGNGLSALSISSTSTGEADGSIKPFEISDEQTSQRRGIVDYLGIRNTTQEASWARYSVDGQEYSSPDNRINIHNRYLVDMKSTTTTPVTIGIKPDMDSLKDSIDGVARSYNNFIRTASEYLEKQPRTTLLIDSMKRMSGLYTSSLNTLGLNMESDGTLSLDDDALKESLNTGEADNVVSNLKDFTKAALRKISKVALNPMDYVDKRIVAYKNPNKTYYSNPYVTSAYSGMLFNGYM